MTKTEIVQAAFKAWGREFYQNTSLSRLAQELGVSKPALYRHFRNKQALTDAMTAYFFDDFADFIRADYERAMNCKNRSEGVFIMIRGVAEYYARNVYGLIFSLINVYDRDKREHAAGEEFFRRGVDMGRFQKILEEAYTVEPLIMHLIFATLTFCMARFHKAGNTFVNVPPKEAINKITATVNEIIAKGLGYIGDSGKSEELDYEGLENRIAGTVHNVEDNPLLKAVAKAVAEAGPWKASMEMVASRSGLSKSSLYGHFKNRQDMLRQLFITEFKRISAFAKDGIKQSAVPGEQLYLGIFSIVVYLRSRPDILTALDWLRTRKVDMGRHKKEPAFSRVFEGINDERLNKDRSIPHWILFLVVSVLMRRHKTQSLSGMPDSDVRTLYRFITLGLEGFKR
jgi:AcrR family transcriptional regulator